MRAQTGKRGRRGLACARRGFSLIELLIVVAVILTIAAIAIPNFIQSKIRANEAAAVQNMRNITTGEVVYSTTYGIGFSSTFAKLGPPPGGSLFMDANNAGLIDDVLAAGTKAGYQYSYLASAAVGGMVSAYTITASPVNPGMTGQRYFFTDQSGVIRSSTSGPADVNSTPLS